MKIDEIKDRIAEISIQDSEGAHSREDRLYRDFIKYVASDDESLDLHSLSHMARLLLTTQKLDFDRWYA